MLAIPATLSLAVIDSVQIFVFRIIQSGTECMIHAADRCSDSFRFQPFLFLWNSFGAKHTWDFTLPDSEALHLFLFCLFLASVVACWAIYEPEWSKHLRKTFFSNSYHLRERDGQRSEGSGSVAGEIVADTMSGGISNPVVSRKSGKTGTSVRQRKSKRGSLATASEDSEQAALLR